jgi:hypothetical protein
MLDVVATKLIGLSSSLKFDEWIIFIMFSSYEVIW